MYCVTCRFYDGDEESGTCGRMSWSLDGGMMEGTFAVAQDHENYAAWLDIESPEKMGCTMYEAK